jgi:hypothetical protein
MLPPGARASDLLTRRRLLGRGLTGAGLALGAAAIDPPATAKRVTKRAPAKPTIPLPSPARIRADFQRMVDFGPRLTGNANHNAYIDWLEQELVDAGVELLPCDDYETHRWSVGKFSLTTLEGSSAGSVPVATYYPRSQETPDTGLIRPLVYGGAAPGLSVSSTDISALVAAIAAYPAELQAWASALQGTAIGAAARNSILLVDLPMPAPLTTGAFVELSTYLQWDGHSLADWADGDYKRSWVMPGLGVPLSPFQSIGAAAVVFICDSSYEALKGAYVPFVHGFEPIPALYVDRDTGTVLRAQAATAPKTRFTLTAKRKLVRTPSIVGILPGRTEESLILNTHTDGQGFAEENGGVCLVHLARHFGSLPKAKRLERSVVFSLFTGHMDPELPETQGFINDNPDLIAKAAAALTIEHFGCQEWIDTASGGYRYTGQPETLGVWTTQGPMFEVVRDALKASRLEHVAMLRPPIQFGVGGAFQTSGVPQLGAIAGPIYLVTVSENGDMDKLDEHLASRQVAWIADIMRRLDKVPAATLRTGDPTLGHSSSDAPGSGGIGFKRADCAPAATKGSRRVILRIGRTRDRLLGLPVILHAAHGKLEHVTIELAHRDGVIVRRRLKELGAHPRRIVLRPHRHRHFAPGRYTLTVRTKTAVFYHRSLSLRRPRHRR